MEKKIVLITGANKGIGFEVAKQLAQQGHSVIIGSRDESKGTKALNSISEGTLLSSLQLDVTDPLSINNAARVIEAKHGMLDILINNAAITGNLPGPPSQTSVDIMEQVYNTNLFGIVRVTNAMLPLLRRSKAARIVNMSSGLASLTLMSDPAHEFSSFNDYMAYQSSKTALNAVTVAYAKELSHKGIKVNAADPGYTATDLNHHSGPRTVQQASIVVIRLATLDENGPTGTFQDEHGIVPW